MLSKEIEIELKNTATGTPKAFKVKKMTLANKCNLDQWVRLQYVHQARKNGIPLKEAEAEAEYLDIIENCWFLPEQRRQAIVMYELIQPSMTFSDFEQQFFSVNVDAMAGVKKEDGTTEFSPQLQRLRENNEAFVEAFHFAAVNPTKSPKGETTATKQESDTPPENGEESTQA